MKELIIGSAAFITDFVGKRLAEKHLENKKETRSFLHDRVSFKLVKNKGVAGGGLADKQGLVKGISAAGLAALLGLTASMREEGVSDLTKVGNALMIGGGAGNLADRLFKGAVTDFICFKRPDGKPGKYVYNPADLALFAGGLLSILGLLFGKKR